MNDILHHSQTDYLTTARKRAERARASSPRPSITRTAPYAGHRPDRYAALTQLPSKPAPAPDASASPPAVEPRGMRSVVPRRIKTDPTVVDTLPVSLADEFARVRGNGEQKKRRIPLPGPIARSKRPVLTSILSLGLVLLAILAIVIGPTVYRATQAYQDIFEDPVPHNDSPFVAAVNPEGTSVIVQATSTAPVQLPEWDGTDRVTILLLGVDKQIEDASRSDTMILVNIDPVAKTARMISIPRDLKVIIPDYGVHKMNAAYAFGDADDVPGGGPGLTIRTIEQNFGLRVNYYAQVDFDGFTKIVDTVGGLTLDVPYPIKDDEYPGPGNQYMRIYFQPGWQHMDGERVLQYARTRHDDGDGRRSVRQQQVLLALREQAVSLDLLPKAPELLIEFGDAVRTDLQPDQALKLARLGSEIDPSEIVLMSLSPALFEEQLPDQPYFLRADWDVVAGILTEFTGTPIVPPMSALANPNYNVQIRIEDGTFNPGLGARVQAVLNANGFANVTVTDKPDLGNYPTSSVTIDSDDLATAYLIAGLLGLSFDSIILPDSPIFEVTATATAVNTPTPLPTATATPTPAPGTAVASPVVTPVFVPVGLFPTPTGGVPQADPDAEVVTIVIVLGDDAPDPAYFIAEPITD